MKLRANILDILEEGLPVYNLQTDTEVINLGKKIQKKGFASIEELRIFSDWKSQYPITTQIMPQFVSQVVICFPICIKMQQ